MKLEEMLNKIYLETKNGFEYVKQIPDKSIDMILCDLPYGTTACKWDIIIPFDLLWEQYNRVIKDSGAIALFGTEPFSSYLRISNLNMFKYDWIWYKNTPCGFVLAKKQPMRNHEIVSVFYKNQPIYNPIKENRDHNEDSKKRYKYNFDSIKGNNKQQGGIKGAKQGKCDELRFPTSVKYFKNVSRNKMLHPTEKPVALFEYLIKTYTNEGDTVLDNCIGAGTTAVACKRLNRNFIGMEIYQNYIDISYKRLLETKQGEGLL